MGPDDQTPRQKVITQILATERPNDLFPILAANEIARDPAVVAELEVMVAELDRSGQAGAADHLRQIARCIRTTFERLDQLARVDSREALLVLTRDSTIAWSPRFYELAEVLVRESDKVDLERASALRRGLAVRGEMQAALEALRRIVQKPATTFAELQAAPVLCDPLFHEYVLLFVRNNIDDRDQAEAWRRAVAALAGACRVFAQMGANTGVHPITFDEAAAWYVLGFPFERYESALRIGAAVAAQGQAPLQSVIDRFIALVSADAGIPQRVMLATAFLENSCRMEPSSAPMFIAEMRRVIATDSEVSYPDPRVRATNALHYAMSLLLRWRAMPSPADVLTDAERLIAEVIPVVDPGRGPRLARDLHWHRGQLLQNLGEWEPDRYADALREFRMALDMPARLQHEHVAKALILSDLANALKQHHLHAGTLTRGVEDERYALLSEALDLLHPETEPLRRSLVLGNAAIFLNERVGGDLGLNQERALEYILEAIRLIAALDEDDNPMIRERRAGLERTRGNILCSRLYGDPFEMAEAAIAAYDQALAFAANDDDWLRGTVQFNRARAYARLSRRDTWLAQTAFYTFEEARSLLRGDRVASARASAAQAALMITDTSQRSQAKEQLAAAISEVREHDAAAAAAPLILQLGTWMLADAETPDQFRAAAGTLVDAIAAHEARGDLAGAAEAALVASHALYAANAQDVAVTEARRSVALSERVWGEARSVEDRAAAGELWSSANAQLLWCASRGREISIEEAWLLSDRSKPTELSARIEQVAQSSSPIDSVYSQFESEVRNVTAQRWRLQRERVTPDASLATAIDALREGASELEELLSLVARQRLSATAAERIAEIVRNNPSVLIIDFSVAASGSVVLVADATGTQVRHAPLTRGMLTRASSLWQSAYRNRRTEPDLWRNALDEFLKFLGEELLRPVLDGRSPDQLARSTVVFVPGVLFGQPLHASSLGGGTRACDLFRDFAYAATLRGLSFRVGAPRRSLCVLSDNEAPPRQLRFPPQEIAAIAATLVSAGVEVTLVALRGAELGSSVFTTAAVPLDARVNVLEERPTPKRVLELLSESEHIFFTGHGIGSAQHGLVLADDEGEEQLLSTLELFGAATMRGKQIVMSACETAHEPVLASGEPLSVSASLLQLGAGFLLGSAWVAIDRVAASLCTAFHREVTLNGWNPVRAFATALRQVRATFPTLSEWANFLPFVGLDP